MESKVLNLERLRELLGSKRRDKKVVFTNGCFDLLHVGHVRYLQKAKNMGDILVVGINSDDSARRLKGEGRPIMPDSERAELVAALDCVDYVTIFTEDTPSRLIMLLRPEIHVKGGDYTLEDLPELEFVESYGGKVVIVEEEKGYSSSEIVKKIVERFGAEAEASEA